MSQAAEARLVVLISGNGSNLQAILDAGPGLPARVVGVVSNKASAYGLERARRAGVQAVVKTSYPGQSRQAYDAELAELVAGFQPDWIVLAGWMRLLSQAFLSRFPGRVINLHPALPGAFPGVEAVARAFAAFQRGEITQTGVMVHLVPDEGVDSGPVLAQKEVPILPGDTLEQLEDRVHRVEHQLLVETLKQVVSQGPPDAIPVLVENAEHQNAIYLARIQEIYTEIDPGTQVDRYTINHDGLANHVVIVDGKTVFRFAHGEFGRRALKAEQKVLDTLGKRMPLPVPVPFYQAEDVIAYDFLTGQALVREQLLRLPEDLQQSLARQLGEFLYRLHQIDDPGLPQTTAPITATAWKDLGGRMRSRVYPLLLPHQRAWAEQVLGFAENPKNFVGPVGLIHGDLAPYHILYNPLEQKLSGVIDFGVAGLGDPASDIGCLLQNYGIGFVRFMQTAYPTLSSLLARARFYAQAIELQWILLGLESGEAFWFTAHLGAARDDL